MASKDSIQAEVLTRALSPHKAQKALYHLGEDPSALVVPCEAPGCTNTVTIGDSFSFLCSLRTTGPAVTTGGHRLGVITCPDVQHYGCSFDCAAAAHAAGIAHLRELHAQWAAQAKAIYEAKE